MTVAVRQALPLGSMTAPASAFDLPTVRIAVQSAMLAAGLSAWLASVGFALTEDADVLVIDDSWLPDPEALADAPAVVALGSDAWATLLPELVSGGYAALSADASPSEVLAGILGAAAGLAVLPPELVSPLPLSEEDEELPLSDVTLTPREKDVLAQLAEGLSNKRAAKELGVSESTIKFHVQAIYSKLGVQSRAGAVTRGIQLGLVSV